jgi:hypothetical protein
MGWFTPAGARGQTTYQFAELAAGVLAGAAAGDPEVTVEAGLAAGAWVVAAAGFDWYEYPCAGL